jgi:predicted nucleic acid-binding protein
MSGDALDTNIFVYLVDETDPRKQEIARTLVDSALLAGRGAVSVSYQVVQETLSALARLTVPARPVHAQEFLDQFLTPLWNVLPSRTLYARALTMQRRYQLHFYDALVVAAALEAGCDRLLTEDLEHGQVFDGLRIENPFLEQEPAISQS